MLLIIPGHYSSTPPSSIYIPLSCDHRINVRPNETLDYTNTTLEKRNGRSLMMLNVFESGKRQHWTSCYCYLIYENVLFLLCCSRVHMLKVNSTAHTRLFFSFFLFYPSQHGQIWPSVLGLSNRLLVMSFNAMTSHWLDVKHYFTAGCLISPIIVIENLSVSVKCLYGTDFCITQHKFQPRLNRLGSGF